MNLLEGIVLLSYVNHKIQIEKKGLCYLLKTTQQQFRE